MIKKYSPAEIWDKSQFLPFNGKCICKKKMYTNTLVRFEESGMLRSFWLCKLGCVCVLEFLKVHARLDLRL